MLPHVRAGKLRPLAVLGTARSPALPDVPTVAESVPGFEVSNWIGLFGPSGMPPAIVARLNAEVQKIMRSPEMQKRLETEHAVIEDTGKGNGERTATAENGEGKLASAFSVVRLGANAAAARDPNKRPLLEKKEQIEQAIEKLKFDKAAIPAAQYKQQLTQLLLELAKLQEALDQ